MTSRLFGRRDKTGMKGLKRDENLEGSCDLCNSQIPPSGGTVTADAMKELVERGFDPYSDTGPVVEYLLQKMEKQGVTRSDSIEQLKMRMVKKQMGDFGLCPKCFKRAYDHANTTFR